MSKQTHTYTQNAYKIGLQLSRERERERYIGRYFYNIHVRLFAINGIGARDLFSKKIYCTKRNYLVVGQFS